MRAPLLMLGLCAVFVSSAWCDGVADWEALAQKNDETCKNASGWLGGKSAEGLSEKECDGAKAVVHDPNSTGACWWYKDHYYVPANNPDRALLYNESHNAAYPPKGWFGGGDWEWIHSLAACNDEHSPSCVAYIKQQLGQLENLAAKAEKMRSTCQAAHDAGKDSKFVKQWDDTDQKVVQSDVDSTQQAVQNAKGKIAELGTE